MNILLVLVSLLIAGIVLWLFLSGKDETGEIREQEESYPDRALRRRASDKQIEEEAEKQRRKTDKPAFTEDDIAEETFHLPYLTDEIIPENSRFRVYRRTLLNSEIYAKKGYYDTSINLYEGVAARINDIKTKEKIEENIEYLKRYMKQREDAKSRAVRDSLPESVTSGDLKFTVDGNKQKRINIEVFDDVTKQSILEMEARLRRELKDDLERLTSSASDDLQEREISELRDQLDELQEKLDQREYDYLDMEDKAKQSELDELNDEIENIKDIVESFKDELSDLERKPENHLDETEEKIDELMEHINILDKKISNIPGKEGQSPGVLDTQPLIDLFNKISGGEKPETSEKTEDKSSISREKEDEDLNEFDLLQDITKPKTGNELSDEEIFEKILRDDKKSIKDDEDSFEIMGERREDEGQYDIFNKEEEKKRQEEEKFYRNFVKTDRKLKKELPILKVNFDFSKLPEQMHLSREQNILEYSFYKYKPMLEKAGELIKKRRVREAIDYYKVVMSQNIPPEFKMMIRKNINDLTEYLEKYLSSD